MKFTKDHEWVKIENGVATIPKLLLKYFVFKILKSIL